MDKILQAEVIYVLPESTTAVNVQFESGSCIEDVILKSGILRLHDEIDLEKNKVGVYSQIKKLSDEVKQHDRIEIYRPLLADPKDARRQRANQKN